MENKEKISIHIPPYALKLMDRLRAAGEEVYIVGGCVRDALLGIAPHDYDMAVSCTPERTLEILCDFRTIATGLAHGTVTAISDGQPVELTTFRVDGSYTDMRRPDSVSFTRSLGEDLSRRDFTVNAMAYGPESSLVDLFGGVEDLKSRKLRAVGDARQRFSEDALRIMRAFRFSAQLGFDIEHSTLEAARDCRGGLEKIAAERIRSEFVRLICSPYPQGALRSMIELGIMPYITGSYTPSEEVISLISLMPDDDVARWGFFLCDADRAVAAEILSRLRCSNREKRGAIAIADNAKRSISTALDARRLRADLKDDAQAALRASVLLGISSEDALALLDDADSPRSIGELAIDGRDLMELGISGREIGEILSELLDAAIEDPSLNEKSELLALAKKKHEEKGE